MKWLTFFFLLCLAALTPACDNESSLTSPPATPRISNFETGTIIVYVHWEEQGIPGKTVEILETDRSKLTDENGIAKFRVAAGAYTIRVHDINRGGPSLRDLDFKVSVDPYQQVTVDVIDCLPCD